MKSLFRHARELCATLVSAAAATVTMPATAKPVAPAPAVQTQVHTLDGHRMTLDVYQAAGPLQGVA